MFEGTISDVEAQIVCPRLVKSDALRTKCALCPFKNVFDSVVGDSFRGGSTDESSLY